MAGVEHSVKEVESPTRVTLPSTSVVTGPENQLDTSFNGQVVTSPSAPIQPLKFNSQEF